MIAVKISTELSDCSLDAVICKSTYPQTDETRIALVRRAFLHYSVTEWTVEIKNRSPFPTKMWTQL